MYATWYLSRLYPSTAVVLRVVQQFHPIYYRRPCFLSPLLTVLMVVTQIRGHIACSSPPARYSSCLAFLSRQDFSSFFPGRLTANCAYSPYANSSTYAYHYQYSYPYVYSASKSMMYIWERARVVRSKADSTKIRTFDNKNSSIQVPRFIILPYGTKYGSYIYTYQVLGTKYARMKNIPLV